MVVVSSSYWLTRFILLYAVAFLVAINQVLPLIGAHGLLSVAAHDPRLLHYLRAAGWLEK